MQTLRRGNGVRRLLASTGLLIAFTTSAAAHPHVWIDAQLAVQLDQGRVKALTITWIFDELYSELVLEDFDSIGDGTLNESELEGLVAASNENLPESSFFTHLRIGGVEETVTSVSDFTAFYDGGLIVYRFTVTLPQPTDGKETPLAIGLFDASYYVEVALQEPVTFDGGTCSYRLEVDENQPLYSGYFFPTYIWLECAGA